MLYLVYLISLLHCAEGNFKTQTTRYSFVIFYFEMKKVVSNNRITEIILRCVTQKRARADKIGL